MKISAGNNPLFIFLSLTGVMATVLIFLVGIFLFFFPPLSTSDMARVYLPWSKWAVPDVHPDEAKLVVNIIHEVPGDKDCPHLRYKWGVLKQPCQITEHWLIAIKGEKVTKEELLKAVQIEGDIDRTGRPDRPLMIRADASAPLEVVDSVLGAAGRAFIQRIDFSVDKPPK